MTEFEVAARRDALRARAAIAADNWGEVRDCIGRVKTWESHISERTLAIEGILAINHYAEVEKQ